MAPAKRQPFAKQGKAHHGAQRKSVGKVNDQSISSGHDASLGVKTNASCRMYAPASGLPSLDRRGWRLGPRGVGVSGP